jgi:antitoxin ParD1/3/4
MPTRNAVLTERQEDFIEALVKSGRYQNASEVPRDALRLMEQREAQDAGKLEALPAAARIGVDALDRGEFKEFEDIEDLQAYLNDLSDKVISRTPNRVRMAERRWRVRLGAAAELDFANILRTLHVARAAVVEVTSSSYRAAPKSTIETVRILHNRMDVERHVPFAPDESGY